MTEIVRTIEDKDVEWIFESEKQDKIIFDVEHALAILLINGVVFLNSNWWQDTWPEEAKKCFSVNVNCNDVFSWGSADAETILFHQLEELYHMWRKDPSWGPAVWCIKKAGLMPQKPVEKAIRAAGIWDLDSMNLRPNKQ